MTQPSPNLFRQEALQRYLQVEEGRGVVRVSPPWTWALLWVVVCALGLALALSIVGKVEVNGRSRGILRPTRGVRFLTSQVAGTVGQVEVRSGEKVKGGAILVRLDAPSVQGQVLEAQHQLELVTRDFQSVAQRQDQLYTQQVAALSSRISKLEEQIASLRQSIGVHERKLNTYEALVKRGLVSQTAVDEAGEALAQAKRQINGSQQALIQAQQDMATQTKSHQDELWQRQQTLSGTRYKRESIAMVAQQMVLNAPEDGQVEAILVKPGDVVQPGQVVGKLIPGGSPLQVVSFLAEKDRGFVKIGDIVHLELDQMPYGEYGTLSARVVRISDDLAAPFEIREALGEDQHLEGPTYRVQLDLSDTSAAEAARIKLRTGMMMNVRYTLRRQRPITLILDPLRRWFH